MIHGGCPRYWGNRRIPGEPFLAGLLISVRNALEAEAALAGGADIIDVKEPFAGSLGAATPQIWREIGDLVRDQKPLSAALGELVDWNGALPPEPFQYVKWGLAGLRGHALRERLASAFFDLGETSLIPVAVAYADFENAGCPRPMEILELAAGMGAPVLLVDTFLKDGRGLLDYCGLEEIAALRHRSAGMGMSLALAGSLDRNRIETLVPFGPDWFAVRGAVCSGRRTGDVDSRLVAELAHFIHPSEASGED